MTPAESQGSGVLQGNWKILDISPKISPALAVFPGDVPFRSRTSLDFPQGHHLKLSSIETTLHLGAHADAPCHYHPQGKSLTEVSLACYLGPCQVVRVSLPRGARVLPEHFDISLIRSPRVLFCTNSFENPEVWREDFNSLSPQLIEALHKRGVCLVGIDTPSIDPASSTALESHRAVYEAGMAVLEGLVLGAAEPQRPYFLSALPLNIADLDASPVRAVLFY